MLRCARLRRCAVFIAAAGPDGGQLLMDPGDFFLGCGEGFDCGDGLLAQHLGPLDRLAGIRGPGGQAPFGFRSGPVEVGLLALLALLARLRALDLPFLGGSGARR